MLKYIKNDKVKEFLSRDYIDFEIFQDGLIRVTNKSIKSPHPSSIYCPESTLLYLLEHNLETQVSFDKKLYGYKKDIKTRLELYYEIEEIMNTKTILIVNRNKGGDRKETLKVYDNGYIQYSYSSNRYYTEREPQLLIKSNPQEVALIMRKLGEKIEKLEEDLRDKRSKFNDEY